VKKLPITLTVTMLAAFGAALWVTVYFCRTMSGGMAMPGGWEMSMMWMPMAGQTWAASAGMFLAMWIAMMVAMMLPSATPMILSHHRGQKNPNGVRAVACTNLMVLGYFAAWAVFGGVVYLLGVLLADAAMRWTSVSRAVPYVAALTVVAAGALQFAPWKHKALSRCRGPFSCAVAMSCGGSGLHLQEGLKCGFCCVTCCLGPTLVLLVLGMMNPLVMLAVAAVIALEKLLPRPEKFIRLAGVCAIIAGIVMVGW
jgi:predicted metal-binding membrane protein